MPGAVVGATAAVVAAPVAAVSIAVASATVSLLTILVDCCLCPRPSKRTHYRVPGLKGEALFSKLPSFFGVSSDRRLVQIRIY
jgi:hypothetical protein